MSSGYDAVVAFRHKKPEDWDRWAPVIKAAYEAAGETGNNFAGSWVLKPLNGWAPSSLRSLAADGIVEKIDTARGGHRAYYRMVDRDGVAQALRDFDVLK